MAEEVTKDPKKPKTAQQEKDEKYREDVRFAANLLISEILTMACSRKIMPMKTDDAIKVRAEILRVARSYMSRTLKAELAMPDQAEGLVMQIKRHVQVYCATDTRIIKIDLTSEL